MKKNLLVLLSILLLGSACTEKKTIALKVLQFNVWDNSRKVDNGDGEIAGVIGQMDADIVFLNEIRNQSILDRIKDTLAKQGATYYGNYLGASTVILSKYPLTEVRTSYDGTDKDFKTELGVIAKAILMISDQRFAVYSLHLDWKNAGLYLPRGYDGNTWEKLDKPTSNAKEVFDFNMQSGRDEEILVLLQDMDKEIEKGSMIIFGGDFNDPSHKDWQEDTKDLRDHNGLVVDWATSVLLQDAGYQDSYRKIYTSAVTHPGFTCPAGNKYVDPIHLQWSEGADSRDRIDFIYYRPNQQLELKSVAIVGPKEDFVDGIIYEQTEDPIIPSKSGVWSSDHKATYAEFEFTVDY